MASFIFIIAFIIIYNTINFQKFKPLFLVFLLLSIFIDGCCSIYPEFHNTKVGYNTPTYLLVFVSISFIIALILLYPM